VGCEFVYDAAFATPTIFQVQPNDAPQATIVTQTWVTAPEMAPRSYHDLYGNPCARVVLPSGRSIFGYNAVVDVPDATEAVDQEAPELAPQDLPDDVLIYTLPSRYCFPDLLGGHAWSQFGNLPGGYRRVQAICDSSITTFASNMAAPAPTTARWMCSTRATGSAGTSPTWRSRSAGR
jgi:hypothetical protein